MLRTTKVTVVLSDHSPFISFVCSNLDKSVPFKVPQVTASYKEYFIEELSRSFFKQGITLPKCNGYLSLSNVCDGAGMNFFKRPCS